MNIWIVIDRYDHSETLTSAHLTEKGAMIKAYNILLEALDNICDSGCYGEDEADNEFKEEYPDAYEFVKNNRLNIEAAKLADLTKYESDLGCFVGEWTEWRTNVEVQVARLQG